MHQKQTYAHVTKAVSFITIVWVTCGSVVIVDALGVAGWWTTIGGSEEVHDSAGCFGGVRSSDSPHGTEVWGSGVHAISNTQVLVETPQRTAVLKVTIRVIIVVVHVRHLSALGDLSVVRET